MFCYHNVHFEYSLWIYVSAYKILYTIYLCNTYVYMSLDTKFNYLVFKKTSKNSEILKLSHSISIAGNVSIFLWFLSLLCSSQITSVCTIDLSMYCISDASAYKRDKAKSQMFASIALDANSKYTKWEEGEKTERCYSSMHVWFLTSYQSLSSLIFAD